MPRLHPLARFILYTGAAIAILLAMFGCSTIQRKLLYFPTHHSGHQGLQPWILGDQLVGYSRPAPSPAAIWLLLHGNGGQAADRAYALPSFDPSDAVYILEYPGFGSRSGKPSKKSFNEAAAQAYRELRRLHPGAPVAIAGESIGTGPASALALLDDPPDKIALVVPFDTLARVARHHFPYLPVSILLRDKWDNVSSLANYKGPIDLFVAQNDQVIPTKRGLALAESLPSAKLTLVPGGHNEWPLPIRGAPRVKFTLPLILHPSTLHPPPSLRALNALDGIKTPPYSPFASFAVNNISATTFPETPLSKVQK